MRVYEIEVTEVLQRVVQVEADNQQEALRKVIQSYDKGDIVLGAEDMVSNSVEIYKNETKEVLSLIKASL